MSDDRPAAMTSRLYPALFMAALASGALALVLRIIGSPVAMIFGVAAIVMLLAAVLLAGIATSPEP